MYIKGVGMTKFGVEDRTTWQMAHESTLEALNDAEMTFNDIDAVVVSTVDTMVNPERQRQYQALITSLFKKRLPVIRVPAVCGGGGAALWTAAKLSYNNILVLGTDKIATNTTPIIVHEIMNAADKVWEQDEGITFPTENALVAQEHMSKYGTTTDDLALVALKNHANAFFNPKTPFYQKKITLEQIKKSQVIASPFRLFDCTMNVNGSAACILTKDKTDIKLKGSGLATDYLAPFEREEMSTWKATILAANQAYKETGLGPSDIGIAEVHDAFTILELMAYEDLGFCKKGEGCQLIREGVTNLDGRLPVNTSGGLKARGHPISATGLAMIYELVKQLRGQCKERQVSNLKYALAQNIGGAGGTISVHILEKVGG
ncbi:MAG: thiolase family protein [Nanoarchaeota archaeon]